MLPSHQLGHCIILVMLWFPSPGFFASDHRDLLSSIVGGEWQAPPAGWEQGQAGPSSG